jgi:hypothetical protein
VYPILAAIVACADDQMKGGKHGSFRGVTHWIEFPVPEWELGRETEE